MRKYPLSRAAKHQSWHKAHWACSALGWNRVKTCSKDSVFCTQLVFNFISDKFPIPTCGTYSKMAHLLYLFVVDSVISLINMGNTRIGYFTTELKMRNLFGYFTGFVNSYISHQCQFAFLPPTKKFLFLIIFENLIDPIHRNARLT